MSTQNIRHRLLLPSPFPAQLLLVLVNIELATQVSPDRVVGPSGNLQGTEEPLPLRNV
jgi:hypothetical protein